MEENTRIEEIANAVEEEVASVIQSHSLFTCEDSDEVTTMVLQKITDKVSGERVLMKL